MARPSSSETEFLLTGVLLQGCKLERRRTLGQSQRSVESVRGGIGGLPMGFEKLAEQTGLGGR